MMTTKIPTQAEYEEREAREYQRQLQQAEGGTLAERREARARWFEAMAQSPDVVAERVGWLLAGNYGFGAMKAAREVAANTRMNRVAALGQMIAAIEWACPQRYATAAFRSLTAQQQGHVNRMILDAIEESQEIR